MDSYDKVLGCIWGAAIGDAMGAATETKTPAMIRGQFGGYVEDLLPGQDDTFAHGCPAGRATDDFSLAYFTAKALAGSGGNVTRQMANDILLEWAQYPEFYRFAGPTTKVAVDVLRGVPAPPLEHAFLACQNNKATNGSAMKIFPAGLISPGNPEKAVEDAITLCLPTHKSDASLAGAAAIAAAVACAAAGGTLEETLNAGLAGVDMGYAKARARGADTTSTPSLVKRIRLAVDIAKRGWGWEETMLELGDIIGSGIAVAEAVPCAFGIFAYAGADVMLAIKMGVNIGTDTDTVATMAGALSGTLAGASGIPPHFGQTIDEVNNFDMEGLARRIAQEFYT